MLVLKGRPAGPRPIIAMSAWQRSPYSNMVLVYRSRDVRNLPCSEKLSSANGQVISQNPV